MGVVLFGAGDVSLELHTRSECPSIILPTLSELLASEPCGAGSFANDVLTVTPLPAR